MGRTVTMFSLNHSQSSVVDVGEASPSILASTLQSPSSMYLRDITRGENHDNQPEQRWVSIGSASIAVEPMIPPV